MRSNAGMANRQGTSTFALRKTPPHTPQLALSLGFGLAPKGHMVRAGLVGFLRGRLQMLVSSLVPSVVCLSEGCSVMSRERKERCCKE